MTHSSIHSTKLKHSFPKAWQGAQPEALSPGSNFLSPQPPARLSCLSLLPARFLRVVDRSCLQLETPGLRAEGARGRSSRGFRGCRALWHPGECCTPAKSGFPALLGRIAGGCRHTRTNGLRVPKENPTPASRRNGKRHLQAKSSG